MLIVKLSFIYNFLPTT